MATPDQYATDNGSTDIAEIIRKHDQGISLQPVEQQRYDAHMAEGAARQAGAGGAANGAPGSGFYDPSGLPAKLSRVAALPFPNFEKAAQGDILGALPKDPLGTPFIDDGQTFSTTGLGGAVSGVGGFSGQGGVGSTTPTASSGGGSAGGGSLATNPNDPLAALLAEARANQAQNVGYVDNTLTPNLSNYRTTQGALLGVQQGQDQQLTNQYNALYGKAQSDAGAANQMSGDLFNQYGGALAGVNASNAGYADQLASTYAGMSQMDPTHQVANQQAAMAALSQAGVSQSNYQNADYQQSQLTNAGFRETSAAQAAFQRAALQQSSYRNADQSTAGYSGITATQQAALQRAFANPEDVANQRTAMGMLQGIGSGSLDVKNGAQDPEARRAQLEALSRYGQLSASPEATAQERFLYEQQRLSQEQQEKASRDALMDSYRVRGMGGSGMELTSILAAGQNNSQNRLLGDLGTQAGAVQRQMQALAGYGNLSSGMVQQGNDVAAGNSDRRLQGTGLQSQLASTMRGQGAQEAQWNAGAANDMSRFNTGEANQMGRFNADVYNQHEMFNAGQANNISMFNANAYNNNSQANANQFNQNQQFNAAGWNQNAQFNAAAMSHQNDFNANAYNDVSQFNAGQANQNSQFNANAYNNNSQFNANAYNTNSMFNTGQKNSVGVANAQMANSNSQYNAGQANTVNMNNLNQNMAQGQFEDQYRATQQQNAAVRASTLANTGLQAGQQNATNLNNWSTTGQSAISDAAQRNLQATGVGAQAATAAADAGRATNNTAINALGTWGTQDLGVAGLRQGGNTSGSIAIQDALKTLAGQTAADQAAAAIAGTKPKSFWDI